MDAYENATDFYMMGEDLWRQQVFMRLINIHFVLKAQRRVAGAIFSDDGPVFL